MRKSCSLRMKGTLEAPRPDSPKVFRWMNTDYNRRVHLLNAICSLAPESLHAIPMLEEGRWKMWKTSAKGQSVDRPPHARYTPPWRPYVPHRQWSLRQYRGRRVTMGLSQLNVRWKMGIEERECERGRLVMRRSGLVAVRSWLGYLFFCHLLLPLFQ